MPSFVYFVILLGISLAATLALRVLLLRTGRQLQKRIGFSDAALTECCTDDPTARLRRHLRSGDDLAVALGAQKLLSDWRLATFLNQRQLGFCGPDAGHDPVEIDQRDALRHRCGAGEVPGGCAQAMFGPARPALPAGGA
jgi:hypothetical protein